MIPLISLIAVIGCCQVQEPHPQPPPRKRGGGYDIPHVIRKRYISLISPLPTPHCCGGGDPGINLLARSHSISATVILFPE
ncbi:MAG: hypothetical protein ACYT04_95235, partial [Nostoc sp.]